MVEVNIPTGYGIPLVNLADKRLPAPTMTAVRDDVLNPAPGSQADSTVATIASDGNSELSEVLDSTYIQKSPAIPDAVGEWWIHPLAVYSRLPYSRTLSGAVSSTGEILVTEHDHETLKQRRVVVAQAAIDDHCAPAVTTVSDNRVLVAWTNHDRDTFIRFKLSSTSGDIRTLPNASEVSLNLVGAASYTQLHRIAGLSDATKDVFWLFSRRSSFAWSLIPVTVTFATGALTFGTQRIIINSNPKQCYISTAESHTSPQTIRVAFGFNPAQADNRVIYFEINCSTGAITSPFDDSVSANVSGTNLPLADTITPVLEQTDGASDRRLHYCRPGPDAPAIATSEWALAAPDAATYKVSEFSATSPDAFDGLLPGTTGNATVPSTGLESAGGFTYEWFGRLPTVAKDVTLGQRHSTALPDTSVFYLRVQAISGALWSRVVTDAGATLANSGTHFASAWGTEVGARLVVDIATQRMYRYVCLNPRAETPTWTQVGTFIALAGGSTQMNANAALPLVVPDISGAAQRGVQSVWKTSLLDSSGTPLAGTDFEDDWLHGQTIHEDGHGKTWSLTGDAKIGNATPGMNVVTTDFGTAGPRVGYNAAANYVPGLAFESPSHDRAVLSAHSGGGSDTVLRHLPDGAEWVSETLISQPTSRGRLIRPYSPVGGGPVNALVTNFTRYSSYTDYWGDQFRV